MYPFRLQRPICTSRPSQFHDSLDTKCISTKLENKIKTQKFPTNLTRLHYWTTVPQWFLQQHFRKLWKFENNKIAKVENEKSFKYTFTSWGERRRAATDLTIKVLLLAGHHYAGASILRRVDAIKWRPCSWRSNTMAIELFWFFSIFNFFIFSSFFYIFFSF